MIGANGKQVVRASVCQPAPEQGCTKLRFLCRLSEHTRRENFPSAEYLH